MSALPYLYTFDPAEANRKTLAGLAAVQAENERQQQQMKANLDASSNAAYSASLAQPALSDKDLSAYRNMQMARFGRVNAQDEAAWRKSGAYSDSFSNYDKQTREQNAEFDRNKIAKITEDRLNENIGSGIKLDPITGLAKSYNRYGRDAIDVSGMTRDAAIDAIKKGWNKTVAQTQQDRMVDDYNWGKQVAKMSSRASGGASAAKTYFF